MNSDSSEKFREFEFRISVKIEGDNNTSDITERSENDESVPDQIQEPVIDKLDHLVVLVKTFFFLSKVEGSTEVGWVYI